MVSWRQREALRAIPGVVLPDAWPPQLSHVEPIVAEGKAASQTLVEDRR